MLRFFKLKRPPPRTQQDIIRESDISDSYSEEVRALVYEYGLYVVDNAIKMLGTHDAGRIEKFCIANRRITQKQLENMKPMSVEELTSVLDKHRQISLDPE